jgi:hypothetical protein
VRFGLEFAAHVRALTAAHAERTKSLLRSIDKLKTEAAALRAANKEHHRSAHIRSMQRRVREQELAVDVLKQALRDSTSLDAAQIDDMVMKKTIAGPLRFRPQVSFPLGFLVAMDSEPQPATRFSILRACCLLRTCIADSRRANQTGP